MQPGRDHRPIQRIRINYDDFPILLPGIDCLAKLDRDEVNREDLDEMIREEMLAANRKYGDDYVEYDESTLIRSLDIGSSLDLMLLDIDVEDDNPFGEDIEEEKFDPDEEDILVHDEYEFSDVDPEVFRDPTLLVKLLKRKAQDDS